MKRIKAFTIMELLVAMIISSVVISMAYLSYHMVEQYLADFKRKNLTIGKIHLLNELLQQDMTQASAIEHGADYLLLSKQDSLTVQVYYYIFPDGLIRKQATVSDTFDLKKLVVETKMKTLPTDNGLVDEITLRFMIEGDPEQMHVYKQYDAAGLMDANPN